MSRLLKAFNAFLDECSLTNAVRAVQENVTSALKNHLEPFEFWEALSPPFSDFRLLDVGVDDWLEVGGLGNGWQGES